MNIVRKPVNRSKQRDAVLLFLRGRKDHPTAEIIYKEVRKEFPNISLGTVYRNLTLLCDIGEIQKISCGDGHEHFDGNITAHGHVVCEQCGAIEDVELDDMSFLNTLAMNQYPGEVRRHMIYFYGICNNCKNSNYSY